MSLSRSLKFELVHDDLKNSILTGKYNQTQKLPSEGELSSYYNCSRPTIRKSLEQLKDEGLISIRHGSGSYITETSSLQNCRDEAASSSETSFLGLIVPNLGSGYIFDSIVNSIATFLSNKGYSLIWGGCLSPLLPDFFESLKQICERYRQLKVKGVLFSPFEYTGQRDEVNRFVLSFFTEAKIPLVLLDSDIDSFPRRTPHDLVSLDHIAASYKLSDHMLSQGIDRLIFLAPPASMETIKLRVLGYHEALIDHGVTVNPDWFVVQNPSDVKGVERVMKKFQPEGIVCSNDGTAVKLMSSLNTLGIRIPEDVLLGGFDNLSYLSEFNIPITSIMQPVSSLAETAVRTLLQRITTPNAPIKTIRLPGELIVRKSTLKN